MKRLANIALGLLASAWAAGQQKPMDQFVTELMGRMTLEEKIGQLNLLPGGDITTGNAVSSPLARLAAEGRLGAVLNVRGQEKVRALQQAAAGSRLGIPLLVGQDVIHGNRTVFPIPLAQSCTWDLEAIEQAARIAAKEATAQGINWIYSPMVDIGIDPRWGRVAEGAGEDPWLGSRIAQALVRGYQGDYGSENAMACVKHFALYGAAEAGRDYNTVDMSRTRMFNQYMQPYKAAVDAGAGSVMSSFNVVDGVPATCNKWLLDDLLRHKWRFGGFVVTDYESINEATVHGLGDQAVCAERALKAGTDMDMCSKAFADRLAALLEAGRISMADIDRACRRVLEAKYKLGLFDDPYRFCRPERLDTDIYTPEHRQAARRMAAESMVLLKNDAHTLPLAPQGRIALIGPLADNRSNMVGCWSTDDRPEQHSTLREAMERAVAGKAEVLYAQGCNIYADATTQEGATFGRPIDRVDDAAARAQALSAAAKADVIVCAMGEMAEMSGESSSRADLDLPDVRGHRQARGAAQLLGPAHHHAVGGRARDGHRQRVVRRLGGRRRHLRRHLRQGQPIGPADHDHATDARTDSGLLQPPQHRTARAAGRLGLPQVSEQLHRPPQRPALPIRLRAELHHVRIQRPDRQRQPRTGDGNQHRQPQRRRGGAALRPRRGGLHSAARHGAQGL